MQTTEIFTPNGQPTVTYVSRNNSSLENLLRGYLKTPNMVISISGPTKSGKTVLLKSVMNGDNLISVSGSTIKTVEDFWHAILCWMGGSTSVAVTKTDSCSAHAEAKGQAEIGIFGVKGKASAGGGGSYGVSSSTCRTAAIDPFIQIVKDISNSDYVLFIDDFHYIPSEVQKDIAKIIKGLAERSVKVCVASVPHRNEDILTANPELRGRIISLEIPEWSREELLQIAIKGFEFLNIDIDRDILSVFSVESVGSPLLMQIICYQICLKFSIEKPHIERFPIIFTRDLLEIVLEEATISSGFKGIVDLLLKGPKVHGVERKQFRFSDGSIGDVYRAILLAVKSDPHCRSFSYDEIIGRVRAICVDGVPNGSSISNSLAKLMEICEESIGEFSILEWDESYLTIIDPYFYFYLRNSNILSRL